MQLDVRDIDSERQRDLAELLLDDAVRIAAGREVTVTARRVSDQSSVVLHDAGRTNRCSRASWDTVHVHAERREPRCRPRSKARRNRHGVCAMQRRHQPRTEEHADPERIAVAVDIVVEALRTIDAGEQV